MRFSNSDPLLQDKSKVRRARSHHSGTYTYRYGPKQGDTTYVR